MQKNELKADITAQKTELKSDIIAMGNNWTTAHKQINAKLDALNVNVTTLMERVSCIDDKVDAIQRPV